MDATIALFLLQDGIVNGAVYALLALALVLIFAVTRVIFVPQGEYVSMGALTLAALEAGQVPGTIWLLIGLGAAAAVVELVTNREARNGTSILWLGAETIALPAAIAALTVALAPAKPHLFLQVLLAIAIVTPMGPYLYRIAFRPLSEASTLVLLIAAVGVHLALTGLCLVFFGAEGSRTSAFTEASLTIGPLLLTGQSLAVLLITAVLIAALWALFSFTLYGRALIATAVNRLGARLVGISPALSGRIAFSIAAFIGALSGVLIAPVTTIYYDTGFLIGLKGFVAAIIGGLVSYPAAALAALFVGVVESVASFYASAFKEVIVFTIIVPVLLWRSLRTTHVEEEEE